MNRRSFLATSGFVLGDQMLAPATPAWAAERLADKARAGHDALRIAPSKLEIARSIALHMDFGFMQLMKYVG